MHPGLERCGTHPEEGHEEVRGLEHHYREGKLRAELGSIWRRRLLENLVVEL